MHDFFLSGEATAILARAQARAQALVTVGHAIGHQVLYYSISSVYICMGRNFGSA